MKKTHVSQEKNKRYEKVAQVLTELAELGRKRGKPQSKLAQYTHTSTNWISTLLRTGRCTLSDFIDICEFYDQSPPEVLKRITSIIGEPQTRPQTEDFPQVNKEIQRQEAITERQLEDRIVRLEKLYSILAQNSRSKDSDVKKKS